MSAKNFIRSFYFKLSLIFLFVLFIMAVVQIVITVQSSHIFTVKVEQKVNLTLASDMAKELEPLLKKDELDLPKIGERIHYMMVMNPKIEIYLLDASGKILAFFAEPGKTVQSSSVNLNPVYRFLSDSSVVPIVGDDPRNPDTKKPFSASKVRYSKEKQGYLYIVLGSSQYDYVAEHFRENYLIWTIVYGLVITVIFAGVLGLVLFALMTRRIRNMAEVVKDFGRGKYNRRVSTKSGDEIGFLAQSFNQMADTILTNMKELKQTDVLRRELIANVSHDLRSPLASIQGYLETILMKEDTLAPGMRRQYLEIILKSTENLNKMVHELFDLSKLEARQIKPNLEKFSVAELTQDIVVKYNNLAENEGIHLKTNIDPGLPYIEADIALIERAVSNLIENALHFTPRGGIVSIELKRSGDHKIRVSVTDSGRGIPGDELPYIFDRYYRGKKNSRKKSGSTGLGLPIAQKIIELHEGIIFVKSTEGSGTMFYFDLNTTGN